MVWEYIYSQKGWFIMPHQELVEKLYKVKDLVKFMDEKGIHGKERGKIFVSFYTILDDFEYCDSLSKSEAMTCLKQASIL